MEAAPDANPGRGSPPVPPNYVSLRQLQELRLKEKEEQERRRREKEAAAAAAAKREAEKAAMAAAVKREAALKAEAKGRAGSWEASVGAKERPRGGRAQGQGNQWVAVAHRDPATTLEPMARGQGAAGKRGAAIGSGGGEKGPDDVPGNGPHGGRKPLVKRRGKGKSKEKLGEEKAAVPSPERGVKPDGMEKPKPPAPRRADAVAGSDSPDGKKPAPAQAQAPPTSAADGSSKPTSGGDSGKEAKPEGLVEGQRWRPVAEAQAVAEVNPRAAARCSAGPLSGRRNWAGEQRGRVWVAKAAAAAAGSSAGAGL